MYAIAAELPGNKVAAAAAVACWCRQNATSITYTDARAPLGNDVWLSIPNLEGRARVAVRR